MTKQWKGIDFGTYVAGLLGCFISTQVFCSSLSEYELSGQINAEYRHFISKGDAGQDQAQPSVLIQPEWYWDLNDGRSGFTFTPFFRYDAMDEERTHVDIRELFYIDVWSDYELRYGVTKVFWGVTESNHLVDVINQTDAVESVDGEDKLGQLMVHFTAVKEWGITEVFLLPYFRERTFAGVDGRLRSAIEVNTNKVRYESDDEDEHVDFALRYSQTWGDWDVGLSYLKGTDRDPYLIVEGSDVIPFYAQMDHFGLDVQGTMGDWLWKLEAIHKDSKETYSASILGFEYTWVGVFETSWDIGLISEYLYDSRGESSPAIGQNDIFSGVRIAVNDASSSEVLLGFTQDLDNKDVQIFKLEASTRLTNHFSLNVEAWGFENKTKTDPLYSLRKDDYIQLGLEYYL